jgi:microcystin-dependent protein
MFKKLLLAASLLANLTWAIPYAEAQNTTCANRPNGDSTNACANTRFVMTNGGGGGGTPGGSNLQIQYNNSGAFGGLTDTQVTARINVFTQFLSGAVPASGGGIFTFLRADGTFAPTSGQALVGTILPWSGATVPPQYLLAYGQAISRSTYSDLFTVLTFQFITTCTSASPTITVSTDTAARVPINAPVEASCFPVGTRVISKTSSTLTMNNNATTTVAPTVTILPWGNGDASTTFNVPNLQGRALVGRDNMSGTAAGVLTTAVYGANPDAINAVGGSQTTTLLTANLPSAAPSGTISSTLTSGNAVVPIQGQCCNVGSPTANALQGNNTGGGTSLNSPVTGTVTSTFTGVNNGGSSTPFSVVQPSVTVDWIIKVLPDASVIDDTITVGLTTVANGTTTNILYNNAGVLGEYPLAALSDMYAGTSGKIVSSGVIWPPEVTVTYGTTTTFNMATFRDAVVTLTGNITTQTVSNVVVGKAGTITFIQDGSGNHTTVWDSKFKFAGGVTPTLTTTAAAVDILSYSCRTSTFCFAAMMNDVK